MTAVHTQLPYQRAIYRALTADATLMALISGVFDNVPPGTAFPYVQLGELTGQPWDTDTCAGGDATLTIHVWSRQAGKLEMKTIMGHVYRILQDNRMAASMNGDGVNCVVNKIDYESDLIDPDGITNHGVQRFRALIQGGT